MNYQANIEQQQQKYCSGMLYLVKNHAARDLKLQYNWLSSKNMSVLSGPILIVYAEQFSWECCLRHWQHWLGNVWNVVPELLIQYCIGYFFIDIVCQPLVNIAQIICFIQHLGCVQTTLTRLWTVGQHCTGNCLVPCWPRQI